MVVKLADSCIHVACVIEATCYIFYARSCAIFDGSWQMRCAIVAQLRITTLPYSVKVAHCRVESGPI